MKKTIFVVSLLGLLLFSGDQIFSQEGGLVWGPDERVNDDPPSELDHFSPCLAVDGAGNSFAVWRDGRTDEDQIFFSFRAFGGGWQANERVSDGIGNVRADIAVDDAGNAYAIWERWDGNIYFSFRPAGGIWQPSERVDDTIQFSLAPTIAIDNAGNAYAVWNERRPAPEVGIVEVRFSFRPAGGSWTASQVVSDREGFSVGAVPCESLAVDSVGNAYLIWAAAPPGAPHRPEELRFSFRPSGGSWQPSMQVNDVLAVVSYVSIGIDGSGNAYAVWNDTRGGGLAIFFSFRPAGGSWSANERVNVESDPSCSLFPSIAVNSVGDAIAVWVDCATWDWILSSFRPSGGSWWSAVNNQVNDLPPLGAGLIGVPTVGIDQEGNGYAIWWSNALTESGNDIFFSMTVKARPDLNIARIDPVQVTFDTDINGDDKLDMILGKPMVVRVTVGITRPDLIAPGEAIDVRLEFEGKDPVTQRRTVSELRSGPVDFFLTPEQLGDKLIRVTVDPNNLIEESNETNNQDTRTVEVKDTRGLTIIHLPVRAPDGSTPTNYIETTLNGAFFLGSVYPIAPSEFVALVEGDEFFDSIGVEIHLELLRLWRQGKRVSEGKAERIVGIVPKEFFEFYFSPCRFPNVPKGISWGSIVPAVFVTDEFWTVEAHEIGHTYTLKEGYDASVINCVLEVRSEGAPTEGFWVEAPPGENPIRNTIDFMGTATTKEGVSLIRSFNRWVSNDNFKKLFSEFLISSREDPKVLLINGLVMPDGTIKLEPSYHFDDGIVDDIEPGEFLLKVFDGGGQVIGEISFATADTLFIEPYAPIKLDTAGFAFAIPYPDRAQRFTIERDGIVLADEEIATKLLRDAINSVPDFGFERNPDQRRGALLNKVNALESQIRNGDLQGAVQKLSHDIRPAVVRWLLDGYEVENSLQFSKAEVLDLIDGLTRRLESSIR